MMMASDIENLADENEEKLMQISGFHTIIVCWLNSLKLKVRVMQLLSIILHTIKPHLIARFKSACTASSFCNYYF